MSELTIGGQQGAESSFRRGTMLLIVAVGIAAFVGMLVLGAYAPDFRSGKNGGAHSLSNAATGFSGLVRLAQATDRYPDIVRYDDQLDTEDLVVLTPEAAGTDMTKVLEQRRAKVTLIVFPKWNAQLDGQRPGWVRVAGLLPPSQPEGVLAPANMLKVARVKTGGELLRTVSIHAPAAMEFPAPPVLQTISGDYLEPIITDASGRIVLGKLDDGPLFVLADPDLINNHGIADARRAAAALALLDFLNSTDAEGIHFDVTLNGLGSGSKSPLRLAFDPPFLAVTLAILAAMILAGLQALVRFGVPLRTERAIAFGKAALVDNSAALVRKAGREGHLGARYASAVRERMATLLRLPPTMTETEVDARLDQLRPDRQFSSLATSATNANTREGVLAAARALHQWQQEASA